MFKDLVDKIKNKISESNQNYEEYQNQVAASVKIENISPHTEVVNPNNRIDPASIVNNCPDLNEEKAKLIVKTIPIDELYLCVLYSREIKTNIEYYIVPTTKEIWLINQYGYIKFQYENTTMKILKKNLMSRVVTINNHALEVTGDKVEYLNNLINDINFRTQELTNKNSTLFGLTPTLRILNSVESGISVDENKNIIFHTKEFHKMYHISQLENYELLLDNNPLIEKKTKMQSRITAGKNACYEMKLRITPKGEVAFTINVLPRNPFEKLYQNTSDVYMNAFKLGRELIDILDDLNEKNLNGY